MVDHMRRWWESPWIGLIVVLVVAALLRYPLLDQVPPGLNFDEGGEGIAALDVSHGVYRLWWPIGGGKEPLMAYLVQPLFWLFGPTRLALRLYTATLGLVAAGGTYWLAWEMFGRRWRPNSERHSIARLTIPLLAGLGLATAFWHVAYSRIAFRALAMPAVEAVALAWFWRALSCVPSPKGSDQSRFACWPLFLGAGVFIGLGAYTYLAGRFVPLAIVLFLILEAVLARFTDQRPLLQRHWRGLVVTAVAAGLVFSPLAIFFARHPAAFFQRGASVSIFSPAWNQGDFWGTLLRTTVTTLGTWASLTGDPNPLGNLPGKPMLSLPLALFFWAGVVACTWHVVRYARSRILEGSILLPGPSPLPYLFLLCWWPVMLLPGILAPEGAPHHLRLIGTGPATYLLVAVGLQHIIWWVGERNSESASQRKGQRRLRTHRLAWMIRALGHWPILPLIVFVPIGLVTAGIYFGRWARLPDLYMAFDVYAVELAGQITDDTTPGVSYVIPMDLRAGHEARHYTLDFLYRGHTPYRYLPVDETTVGALLTDAAFGQDTLRVVWWAQDKHMAADEREVTAYLLATNARAVGEETYPVYRVETWEMPSRQTIFRLPAIRTEVGATFGDRLQLEAAHIQGGDGQVAVALRWAPLAPMDVDYKASLRLMAADGSVAAQKDRFLQHNWHQGTSLWPDETVNEYYLLSPVSPGRYQVRVVVYHPETLAPLMVDGQGDIAIGTVWVE